MSKESEKKDRCLNRGGGITGREGMRERIKRERERERWAGRVTDGEDRERLKWGGGGRNVLEEMG